MSGGEILTRVTIWITILAYAASTVVFALSRKRSNWDSAARLTWTVACAALLVHILSAYHFYHGWSHDAAYRETARQTNEVFGVNWGGGLYINYALVLCWVMDAGWWWWRGLDTYRRRRSALVAVWHGFLIFIFFNAMVIFGTGLVRWVGLCICLGLCLAWCLALDNSTSKPDEFTVSEN